MKKLLLVTLTLLAFNFCFSQISVTATAGTTGPTSYTTLKSAFDAINTGTHQGVITITVNGTTSEIASAVLNASGSGSASYTGISIKPTGGVASVITGNIAAPLIDINGADNITIDGLNNGGSSLTISNTSTSNATNTSTIRFINDATANTIQNTTVLGAGTGVTLGTIYFSTGTTIGNDNNTIANCNIADASGAFPVNAIYSSGTTTAGQENSGITLLNNNISNFFNADLATVGVLISSGNTDWTLNGNKFFQTAARTFTTANTHRAIQILTGNNYSIINNIIGYSSSSATGIYSLNSAVAIKFVGIELNGGSTIASSIQNNTVTNFLFTTASGANTANGIWCAIDIISGDANVGTVTGNTIGSTTGTGSITITPSVAGTWTVPITSASTGNVTIANNRIGGIDILPTGVFSGNIFGILSLGGGGNININNNIIGSATADNIKIGVLGTTTGNGALRGIFITNSGTISITSNTIRNLTHNSNNGAAVFRGIECQAGSLIITGNSISNITTNGASTGASTPECSGIQVTSTNPGIVIDQNIVFNLNTINSTTTFGIAVTGIYAGANVNGISISRNRIYGFSNASTSVSTTTPGTITGIYLRNLDISNPATVVNNMISFGNSQNTNTSIIGIWNSSNTTNFVQRIYYNSVNIEGTVTTGAQPSFCYYRGDFSTTALTNPTVDIKNNIFTNSRSGGTGKHYAIANGYGAATSSASGWGTNASDYNVLNDGSPPSASSSTVGYWSGDQTFSGWQTASASDAHSLSGVTVNYVNSASDLHLVTASNSAVDGKATPITGFTTDFDGQTRNAVTPDIGADEFTATVLAIAIEYFKGAKQSNANVLSWKVNCNSASIQFDIERSSDGRNFLSIGNFSATQSRCVLPFDFTDNNITGGINYYRLKMTESDGKISYSTIVAIINKENGFEIVSLLPTIVRTNAVLNVSSAQKTKLQIVIIDMQGRSVQKANASLDAGSNTIALDLSKLAEGVYQLTGYTTEGDSKTLRFVKQ